jgi:tetratricopeptide (TPR) repeat protein
LSDHPTEDELARYAFDPASVENAVGLAAHLGDCPDCAALLRLIETVDAGLADRETWELSEATRSLGSLDQTLHDLVSRIADEDEEAERLLEPLLANPVALARMNLAEKPKYRTGGVVRHLIAAATANLEREPLEALSFADAAIEVAETLPDDTYTSYAIFDLRGTAWKERANALRLLGKYEDALVALDRATDAFRQAPLAPIGPASVKFIRATVLYERGELEDAFRLAEESAAEFSHFGDIDRVMRARQLQANIRFHQGDIPAARKVYEEILRYGQKEKDLTWIARAARLLGRCALDLGDLDAARRHFEEAIVAFNRLGLTIEVLRSEWGPALVALAEGKSREAVKRLRDLQKRFLEHSLLLDSALVALDSMDGLYALGETREIARVAAELTDTFTRAGMLTSALTAFAYLRESAAEQKISPRKIDHVRRFIRRIEREPTLLFAPPPPELR